MKRTFTLVLFSVFFQFSQLAAQSTSGTEFWLAFMENLTLDFNGPPTFSIHISSDIDTDGAINVPATGFTQPFIVNAGTQIEVSLPVAIWYSEVSEMVEGKGIKITSDEPIEVSATHFRLYFTEATGVLPLSELSDEYFTTCFIEEGSTAFPSSLVIVATEDDTEIEIIPAAFTLGLHAQAVPFNIILDEGEIYQIQALDDLTGTGIRSLDGEKIAVFSGAQQARVLETCDGFADNHLWEQSQPFSNWSKLYYFVPFKNQGGDLLRILAKEDGTVVNLDCGNSFLLNRGDYNDLIVSDATVISATNDIAVTQFNQSQSCNSSNIGDPSMLRLLPTEKQTQNAKWWSTSGTFGINVDIPNNFVNIVMKTSDVGTIALDGVLIGNEFTPFPADATISFLQKNVSEGVHELASDAPFHAYYYGFGDFDAYTKAGDYQQTVDLEYVCLDIEVDGIFCVDSLINFTANSNFEIASYNWQTSDSQTSILEYPDLSFSTAGDYTVSLTVLTSSGQSFTESYDLTIQDCAEDPCDPDATTTISVVEDCVGTPSQFSFTSTVDFVSVEWNFGDSPATSSENAPSNIYSSPGTYNVILTGVDAFNCEYSEGIVIMIEDCNGCGNPILDIIFTGNPCVGEEIIFESTYEGIPSDLVFINWDLANGFPSNEVSPTTVYQFPGSYDVMIDIFDATNDCIYTGTTIITIEDCSLPCTNLPDINLLGDLYQCIGETSIISIETSAQLVDFEWFVNGVSTGQNTNSYSSTPVEAGIVTISLQALDADGCEYEGLFEFEVGDCNNPCDDYDIGQINVEGEFCIDSLLTFSNSIPDSDADYLWIFDNGENFSDSNIITTFSEETTVNVLLQVVNEEGCEDEADFTFSIENCESVDDCLFPPNSVVILELIDQIYCVGSSVDWRFGVENDVNIVSVLWEVSDGQTFTDFSPFIPVLDTNFVEVRLEAIDENGCIYLDTFSVNFYQNCEEFCQIFVPNAFTPNGDDANDTFKPLSACEPETYSFEIYSRWGELMFQTKDFNETWDGIHRGKPVTSDVYAWVMNYSFSGQGSETVVGDISVIR